MIKKGFFYIGVISVGIVAMAGAVYAAAREGLLEGFAD